MGCEIVSVSADTQFVHLAWQREEKDLADDAWRTRLLVERGLVTLGAAAVPALVEACGDPSRHVRLLAAHALGYLNDDAAVAPLIAMAGGDDYDAARLMAVEALGRLGAAGNNVADVAFIALLASATESIKIVWH